MVLKMSDYMTKADLYRAACAGQPLPDGFVKSLRWHLIRAGSADAKSVAIRAAISLAEEWKGVAEASRALGQEEKSSLADYHAGSNHQATYCANMLLRHLAQELYRDSVPRGERVL